MSILPHFAVRNDERVSSQQQPRWQGKVVVFNGEFLLNRDIIANDSGTVCRERLSFSLENFHLIVCGKTKHGGHPWHHRDG